MHSINYGHQEKEFFNSLLKEAGSPPFLKEEAQGSQASGGRLDLTALPGIPPS